MPAQLFLFDMPDAAPRVQPAEVSAKRTPWRKHYAPGEGPVYGCVFGMNADLMVEAYRMYLHRCAAIADVTFGKGAFWKKVDLSAHTFLASDLLTCPDRPYDFRSLPYEGASLDAVVLDPPYMHNPGRPQVQVNYQNGLTTKGMYHRDIIELYRAGMEEARRVLRPGGLLLVKCQDEIESSRQCRSTIEIWQIARELGLEDQDRFTLIPHRPPLVQRYPQQHARRVESVLWIFRKPDPERKRLRTGP